MAKLFFILLLVGALVDELSPSQPPLAIDASQPNADR